MGLEDYVVAALQPRRDGVKVGDDAPRSSSVPSSKPSDLITSLGWTRSWSMSASRSAEEEPRRRRLSRAGRPSDGDPHSASTPLIVSTAVPASSRVPQVIRMHSGRPKLVQSRTMTPFRSAASATAVASPPRRGRSSRRCPTSARRCSRGSTPGPSRRYRRSSRRCFVVVQRSEAGATGQFAGGGGVLIRAYASPHASGTKPVAEADARQPVHLGRSAGWPRRRVRPAVRRRPGSR